MATAIETTDTTTTLEGAAIKNDQEGDLNAKSWH